MIDQCESPTSSPSKLITCKVECATFHMLYILDKSEYKLMNKQYRKLSKKLKSNLRGFPMKGHIFLKFIERVQSFFDLSLWPVSCLRSCEEKKLWNNFFTNFMSACWNAPCKANLISHSERSNHLCKKKSV